MNPQPKVVSLVFGCAHNKADTEAMNLWLRNAGYDIIESVVEEGKESVIDDTIEKEESECQLFLVNSCTVKDPSEAHALNVVRKFINKGMKGILAGCVPQSCKLPKDIELFVSDGKLVLLGTGNTQDVAKVMVSLDSTPLCLVSSLDDSKLPPLPRVCISKSPVIIVPICVGCLNHCSYCKTVVARGTLHSYLPSEIISSIRSRMEYLKREICSGGCEVWLTGEDTSAYGLDFKEGDEYKGLCLGDLMELILDSWDVEGDSDLYDGCMLRVGMANPQWLIRSDADKKLDKEYHPLKQFLTQLARPRCFKFIHIPVQSGSLKVLKAMRRPYTPTMYRELIKYINDFMDNELSKRKIVSLEKRSETTSTSIIPSIVISTDLIAGFPGETDEDQADSVALIEDCKFQVANVSHYYARRDTEAAKMECRIPTHIVKSRSSELTRHLLSNFHREVYVGMHCMVMITEERIKPVKSICGRTESYIQINIPVADDVRQIISDEAKPADSKRIPTEEEATLTTALPAASSHEAKFGLLGKWFEVVVVRGTRVALEGRIVRPIGDAVTHTVGWI